MFKLISQCFPRSAPSGAACTLIAFLMAGSAVAATTPRDASSGRTMYSGASMSCLVANDFYAVHFTAIQEGRQKGERSDFEKYCQEVPQPGKTYLTLDLFDRDARTIPIKLRVIEEEWTDDGQLPKEKATLAETPSKIYKNGIAEIQANISAAGHYAVIATFGEEGDFVSEDDRLRVPFSVGLVSPAKATRWPGAIAALVGLFLVSSLGFFVYRGMRDSRAPLPEAAEDGKTVRRPA